MDVSLPLVQHCKGPTHVVPEEIPTVEEVLARVVLYDVVRSYSRYEEEQIQQTRSHSVYKVSGARSARIV